LVALLLQYKADVRTEIRIGVPVLISAVLDGQAAIVELLLRASPYEVNITGEGRMTALHYAVEENKPDMVASLLRGRAYANARHPAQGTTPLMLCKNVDIARMLLENLAYVDPIDVHGDTALSIACRRGDAAMAELMLDHHAGNKLTKWLDKRDRHGFSALHYAIVGGELSVVQRLVKAGADVYAALRLAIKHERWDIARFLMSAGDTGDSALIHACEQGNMPAVAFLLEGKSDINAQVGSVTPLIVAASDGHLDVVKALLAADPPALVNGRSRSRGTALMSAARDKPLVIQALLAAGADPLLVDNFGATALMHSRGPACVRLLVEAGPKAVNMVDRQKKTALMRWTRDLSSDKDLVNELTELFASSERCGVAVDVNKRNSKGISALDEALAAWNHGASWDHGAVSLLLSHGAVLDHMAIIKVFQRGMTDNTSDETINACFRSLLKHTLDTGCLELPVVIESEEVKTEDDEPLAKRRRRRYQ
jgi:ankyrin repeat protein